METICILQPLVYGNGAEEKTWKKAELRLLMMPQQFLCKVLKVLVIYAALSGCVSYCYAENVLEICAVS